MLKVQSMSLLILAALTAGLAALQNVVSVGTVTIAYLIAVLFAALRGGMLLAVITGLVAIGCAAFFFYPPIYDFRVHNPIHLIDLSLFIVVSVVIGKLATDVRKAKLREEADTLREALIGSVSHELRTPLSSIVGTVSVLLESPDIAHHRQLAPLVNGLRGEADRLNEHIQNLLDATRISSEGIRPRTEWVDPADIVNSVIERKGRLFAGYQLEVAVESDLPLIWTDPMLIEKAMGQIIENATKYSPPGSTIGIKASHVDGAIRLAVQDQGAGLAPKEDNRIWERFYRGERHRDTTQGSGLGLWIARSLVVAGGGTVDAASAGISHGTTVTITLPVASAADTDRDESAND